MNALGFAWAFLVLVTSILALILGIVAFWKGNRQELSATETRLARGGLLISCVWLLCFAIAVLLPHRHPSPVPILCTSELKMMRIALMLYHAEYDIFPAPSELEYFIEKENLYDESRKKIWIKLRRSALVTITSIGSHRRSFRKMSVTSL